MIHAEAKPTRSDEVRVQLSRKSIENYLYPRKLRRARWAGWALTASRSSLASPPVAALAHAQNCRSSLRAGAPARR